MRNRAVAKYSLADLLYFLSGLVLGVTLAIVLHVPRRVPVTPRFAVAHGGIGPDRSDPMRDTELGQGDTIIRVQTEEESSGGGNQLARELAPKVSLLVWVKTSPQTLNDRAAAVKETWGKRLDKLLFISSVPNETFPAIGLNVKEGRDYDATMTIQGFRYIYENHLHNADWFMQADDDTFVIVENLLYFLSEERAQEPVYYGPQHHHRSPQNEDFNCVGGGYVLGREALKRFGQDENECRQKAGEGTKDAQDFQRCLDRLGIELRSSADALGRSRFHCLELEGYMPGTYPNRLHPYKFDPQSAEKAMESISDYTITFHGVKASTMSWIYYYVYQLAAHGVPMVPQQLNTPSRRLD